MPNKRPAHRDVLIVLGTILLCTAAITGILAYRKHASPNDDPSTSDAIDDFIAIEALSRSPKASDRLKASQLKKDSDSWFAEVLARNPGLEPKWKQVPDERNGFLQMLDLAERYRGAKDIGDGRFPGARKTAEEDGETLLRRRRFDGLKNG